MQACILLDPTIHILHHGLSIRLQNGHKLFDDSFEAADLFNGDPPKLEKSLLNDVIIQTFPLDRCQPGVDLDEFLIDLGHFLDEVLLIFLTVKIHVDKGLERNSRIMVFMSLQLAYEADKSSLLTLGAQADGIKRLLWV